MRCTLGSLPQKSEIRIPFELRGRPSFSKSEHTVRVVAAKTQTRNTPHHDVAEQRTGTTTTTTGAAARRIVSPPPPPPQRRRVRTRTRGQLVRGWGGVHQALTHHRTDTPARSRVQHDGVRRPQHAASVASAPWWSARAIMYVVCADACTATRSLTTYLVEPLGPPRAFIAAAFFAACWRPHSTAAATSCHLQRVSAARRQLPAGRRGGPSRTGGDTRGSSHVGGRA